LGGSVKASPFHFLESAMNIIFEGPEKAGKTTLVNWTLKGFEPTHCNIIKISGPEKDELADEGPGFGYLFRFVESLDSHDIIAWDRGWVSENVYGNLLQDNRHLAKDPFKTEWFYGRALEGRGGKYIVLPNDPRKLAELRDETDQPVDPIAEYRAFQRYANHWGYEILYNNYTPQRLKTNMLKARRSPFVGVHKSDSSQYIGSRKPILTFVGDSTPQFEFANMPFYCENSMEYFRPFGRNATHHFGYCTIEAVDELRGREPDLFSTVITMGPRAFHCFPEYPNVQYQEKTNSYNDIVGFMEGVVWAAKEYEINGRTIERGMKWPI
jgi:hypothetical protein